MTTPELGARSTGQDALRGRSLRGVRAIVTGASSGLGVETTRVLAAAGADVVLAVRNVAAGNEVAAGLRAALPAGAGALEVHALDLADLTSVRSFAAVMRDRGTPIELLVNNAGVMATPRATTVQGHELQIGTNHLGHFLLTALLRPALEAAESSRVVTLASGLHERGRGERMLDTLRDDPAYTRRKYVRFDAYGDAKLANVLFIRALAKRLPSHVGAFAVHPGVIATPLTRSMGVMGAVFRVLGRPFMKSVEQGTATTIHAATDPELRAHSGTYLADCTITQPSVDGRDDALAQTLWDVSETLVA